MTISQLKVLRTEKQTALFERTGMFFAFSNEQFAENKTPLKEGEKYRDLGAGAYCPASQAEAVKKGFDEINQWWKDMIIEHDLREKYIIHELYNHEAFYTHEIEPTVDALGEDYTFEEVKKVFYKELPNVDIW